MKNIFLYIIFFIPFLTGCDNYLDVVPEKDIMNIESSFEKSSEALKFLFSAHSRIKLAGSIPLDPAMCGADEFVGCEYTSKKLSGLKIAQGLNNPSDPILPWIRKGMNMYINIRNANIFIDNIDKVYNLTFYEKDIYKSYAYAIKGFYYFELMKMYGPIVLVPNNISVEAPMEEMQFPRQPIDTVVEEIVKIFDKALVNIPPMAIQNPDLYGLLNKEAVMVLKAKTLLYAASPLYNGNPWYSNYKNKEGVLLFNPNYDPKKWERAAKAIDDAIEFCEEQGKKLVGDADKESSELLNTIRDIQNSVFASSYESDELIWGLRNLTMPDFIYKRFHSRSQQSSGSGGSLPPIVNPTMRMVEMFYTENGLPIEMDPEWNYVTRYQNDIETRTEYKNVVALNKPILNLHLHREPRFYANISFDRGITLVGSSYKEMCPYFGEEHGTSILIPSVTSSYNTTGYWVKKMMSKENLAGNNNASGPYVRIRLAELYLMQAEAWNEVGIEHKEKVYEALNKVRERAGIPSVQESWAKSTMPEKINSQEGLREIIRQETNIELAFEGKRFWNIRRWKIAHEVMNTPIKGWNIYGSENKQFYNNFNGPVVVWNKNSFESPRDYFWPYKDEEVLKANIVQNLGW